MVNGSVARNKVVTLRFLSVALKKFSVENLAIYVVLLRRYVWKREKKPHYNDIT